MNHELAELDERLVLNDEATDCVVFQEPAKKKTNHLADTSSENEIQVSHLQTCLVNH